MPSVEELGQKVKAKYPGQYGDLSDLELGRRVKDKYPDAYADFSGPTAVQPALGAVPVARGIAKLGVESLPLAGATVGGMLGTPAGPIGQRLGAALGGGGGEAYRQVAGGIAELLGHPTGTQLPETSAQAIKQILQQGAIGAGTQFGGQLLGGGTGIQLAKTVGGQKVLRDLPGVLPAVGQKLLGTAVGQRALTAVAKHFPGVDVLETMAKEGIPAGRILGLGRKGTEIAAQRVATRAATVNGLLQQADEAGHLVPVDHLLQPVEQYARRVARQPAGQGLAKQIMEFVAEDRAKYGSMLTPSQANELIQGAQKVGFKGIAADITSPGRKQYTATLQRAGNAALRKIPDYGRDIAAAKRALQGSMAAEMTVKLGRQTSVLPHILGVTSPVAAGGAAATLGGGGPTERAERGIGTAMALHALTGPSALSSLGLLLGNPALAPLLTFGARAATMQPPEQAVR